MDILPKKMKSLVALMLILVAFFASVTIVKSNTPDKSITPEDIYNEDFELKADEEDNNNTTNEDNKNDNSSSSNELVIPEQFKSALDAYLYAHNYLTTSTGVYSVISGSVDAGVATQQVIGVKKIDSQGNFYNESVSKKNGSIGVDLAERIYIPKNENKVYIRSTKDIDNSLIANYKDPYSYTSQEEYLQKNKILPTESNYIINDNTVKGSSIRYSASDKKYYGTLILNQDAVEKYKYKVKESSGSSIVPNFTSIEVSFTLDKYGRFLNIKTIEVYEIKIVINVTTKMTINETFKAYNNSKVVIDEFPE